MQRFLVGWILPLRFCKSILWVAFQAWNLILEVSNQATQVFLRLINSSSSLLSFAQLLAFLLVTLLKHFETQRT